MLYNVFPEIFQPKVQATWKEQKATSKTICARNLSYSVEREDMYVLFFVLVVISYFLCVFLISKWFREILFKECGEIVDIRLQRDREGRSRGFGHVQFATTEAAQKVGFVTLSSLCKSFQNCQNDFKELYLWKQQFQTHLNGEVLTIWFVEIFFSVIVFYRIILNLIPDTSCYLVLICG